MRCTECARDDRELPTVLNLTLARNTQPSPPLNNLRLGRLAGAVYFSESIV